jgi:hypothetical protein
MPVFEVLFKLSPPAVFGLPDGDKVVIPTTKAGEHRKLVGPTLDVRSRVLVSHGTLPQYRGDPEAVHVDLVAGALRLVANDNFVRVFADTANANEAYAAAMELVELVCQGMAAQVGVRFSAEHLSVQDANGTPQGVERPGALKFLNAAIYNTSELQKRLETAFAWAARIDDRGRKALLYLEHGCLLSEFADTLPIFSPHASFSWALAFLQLYKALTTLLGEPGTDRDYQSRAGRLGLPSDFWLKRVKELYEVRNDEDVAHYSLKDPHPGAMQNRFGQAAAVFKDAFAAYMRSLPGRS